MSKQILSREKIIEIAIELIKHDEPLTFSNLARHLGTKSQALYPYFKNQANLNYAILAESLDKLTIVLKDRLLGITGQEALLKLALTCRNIGLSNIKLSQFIVTLPRDQATTAAQKSINELKVVFNTLLASTFSSPKIQLLGGRMIRNLIIGELINVGTGWFSNQQLPQMASFEWMAKQSLGSLVIEDHAL